MVDIRNISENGTLAVNSCILLDVPPAYGVINSPVSVKLDGKIVKGGELFIAKCDCFADIVVECALCLSPVNVNINFELNASFSETETDGKILSETQSGEEIWGIFDKMLDLKPAVESDLYSLIPMKQLCKEGCEGLEYLLN